MNSAPKPQLPKPSADHRLLEVFIGKWHAEGTSYADGRQVNDPLASAVPWTSDETYEWLRGDFFVLHRWDAMAGERVFKGTEIIGYDVARGAYFTRLFDQCWQPSRLSSASEGQCLDFHWDGHSRDGHGQRRWQQHAL